MVAARDRLDQLLRAPAVGAGGAVAVVDGDVRLSYRQLDGVADLLRSECAALGEGEAIAVVAIERSWRLVAVCHALLVCGYAFAIVDPGLPADRRASMLRAIGSAPVISWPPGGELAVDFDRFEPAPPATDPVPYAHRLGYIIFTSGSTGTPKAAAIERHSLAELIDWHVATFGTCVAFRSGQVVSSSFDVWVWEVFCTLGGGGELVLVHEDDFDPHTLWRRLAELDLAFVPTPLAHLLFADEALRPDSMRLRTLLTGGDRLLARPRKPRPYRFFDQYGPSECAVIVTSTFAAGDIENVPVGVVGSAIRGSHLALVDDELRPVPRGAVGELLIGGGCVGRGYLNDPAKTARSFVKCPAVMPGRAYRSGDLFRLVDGDMFEFHGRLDAQVKHRGYRIELGDVEHALLRAPDVLDAVAGIKRNGGTELVAVALVRPGAAVAEADLYNRMRSLLPAYMIPSRIELVTDLPRTASGKLDRKATIDSVR